MSLNFLNLLPSQILPLYLLLFGHICADYLCQSKKFVCRKREKNSYFLFHIFLVWLFAFLFFLPYRSGKAFAVVTILAFFHLAIDRSKIRLEKTRSKISQKMLNVVDQFFHFLLILLAWRVFFFNLPLPSFFSGRPGLLNFLAVLIIILNSMQGDYGSF